MSVFALCRRGRRARRWDQAFLWRVQKRSIVNGHKIPQVPQSAARAHGALGAARACVAGGHTEQTDQAGRAWGKRKRRAPPPPVAIAGTRVSARAATARATAGLGAAQVNHVLLFRCAARARLWDSCSALLSGRAALPCRLCFVVVSFFRVPGLASASSPGLALASGLCLAPLASLLGLCLACWPAPSWARCPCPALSSWLASWLSPCSVRVFASACPWPALRSLRALRLFASPRPRVPGCPCWLVPPCLPCPPPLSRARAGRRCAAAFFSPRRFRVPSPPPSSVLRGSWPGPLGPPRRASLLTEAFGQLRGFPARGWPPPSSPVVAHGAVQR